ncbi:hypothetical protein GCM10023068_32190 [Leifsonia shinshuensis]
MQVVEPARSIAAVEEASTAGLPKKSCCIDMPVMPGIMIGSFGAVSERVQVSVKMPGFAPPAGNPVVITRGGADEATVAAVAAAAPAARTRAAPKAISRAAGLRRRERRDMVRVNARRVRPMRGECKETVRPR